MRPFNHTIREAQTRPQALRRLLTSAPKMTKQTVTADPGAGKPKKATKPTMASLGNNLRLLL
jgi:hypothetical protein